MLENFTLTNPEIQARFIPLRATKLADLDLEQEILENYNSAKTFLENLDQSQTQVNQVAQVYNSISAILRDLVKMQTDLYNAERVKILENTLFRAIQTLPQTTQNQFLDEYEKCLATI